MRKKKKPLYTVLLMGEYGSFLNAFIFKFFDSRQQAIDCVDGLNKEFEELKRLPSSILDVFNSNNFPLIKEVWNIKSHTSFAIPYQGLISDILFSHKTKAVLYISDIHSGASFADIIHGACQQYRKRNNDTTTN